MKPISLEMVRVPSPCPVPWTTMSGTERVRYCGQCRQSVYNLSELSRGEAEALIREHNGDMCATFFQRPDGTVMTRDCPELRRKTLRERLVVFAGLCVSIFVVLPAWLLNRTRDDGSSIRDHEPFNTIMEWIDPTPKPAFIFVGGSIKPPAGSAVSATQCTTPEPHE